MSDARIQIEIDSAGIADVKLTRGDKMNAVDTAMFVEVAEAGRNLARDKALRAVVLSGEGRAFCAGLDTGNFAGMAGGGSDVEGANAGFSAFRIEPGEAANAAQEFAWVWHDLPVPVIAAVHGVCFGAGLQLALAADIRFVTPDAKLSILEMKWGLIPDVTGTQTLRHLLPLDVIKELTYTARILSGTEAAHLGLATHVSEIPHEAAHELAREIATRSPTAVRAAKQLLDASVVGRTDDGLRNEAALQRKLIGSPNQIEAVMSNLQKRPAEFNDPE